MKTTIHQFTLSLLVLMFIGFSVHAFGQGADTSAVRVLLNVGPGAVQPAAPVSDKGGPYYPNSGNPIVSNEHLEVNGAVSPLPAIVTDHNCPCRPTKKGTRPCADCSSTGTSIPKVIAFDFADRCTAPDLSKLKLKPNDFYTVRIDNLNLNLYQVSVSVSDTLLSTALPFPSFAGISTDGLSGLMSSLRSSVDAMIKVNDTLPQLSSLHQISSARSFALHRMALQKQNRGPTCAYCAASG
jgi:hypothetical protein